MSKPIDSLIESVNEPLVLPFANGTSLDIKREDRIHPIVSGNKYRKLRYNIAFAKANSHTSLLTFGGAYSNHIAATAAAGKLAGIKTIGVIRGEELAENLTETLTTNPTLAYAKECGMQFRFISRSEYRQKYSPTFLDTLRVDYGNVYIVPEGGTNELAIKGCEEILTEKDKNYDYICCALGTGGTISGIINSTFSHQKVLGFPALKGDFLKEEIAKWTDRDNWQLVTDYHFGGYAKTNPALIDFINAFGDKHNITLDPVYTGKMLFGIIDLISKGFFPPNSRILAIHTGGLQGIAGMNKTLLKKGLSPLKYTE